MNRLAIFGGIVNLRSITIASVFFCSLTILSLSITASVALPADQRQKRSFDVQQLAAELDAIHSAARQAWRAKQFAEIRDLHSRREAILQTLDAIEITPGKSGPNADPIRERLALWQKSHRAVAQARVLTQEMRYHEAAGLLAAVIDEWPNADDDSVIYGDLSVQLFLTVQAALYLHPEFLKSSAAEAESDAPEGTDDVEKLVIGEDFLREAVARARSSDPCQFDAAFILAHLEQPSRENTFLRAENRPELRKRNELLLDAEAVAAAGQGQSEVTKAAIAWLKAQSSSFVIDDLWYLRKFLEPDTHLHLQATDSSQALITRTNDLVGYVSTDDGAFPTVFIAPQPMMPPEPHAIYLFDMNPTSDGAPPAIWPLEFRPAEGKSAVRDQVRELIQSRGRDTASAVERMLNVMRVIDGFRGVPAEKSLKSAFENLWLQAHQEGNQAQGAAANPAGTGDAESAVVAESLAAAQRLVEEYRRFCGLVEQNWPNYYRAYPEAEEDISRRWRDVKAGITQAEAVLEQNKRQLTGMAEAITSWRELFCRSVPPGNAPLLAGRSVDEVVEELGIDARGKKILESSEPSSAERREVILLHAVRDLDVVLYQQYLSLQSVADMLVEVRRMRASPAIQQMVSLTESRLAQEHLLASLDGLSVVIRNCSHAALFRFQAIRKVIDPGPAASIEPVQDDIAERFRLQRNGQWQRLADPIERLMTRMKADALGMQQHLNKGEVSADSLRVLLERVRGIDDALMELGPKGYFDILDADSIPRAATPNASGSAASGEPNLAEYLVPGLDSALASPSSLQRTLLFTRLIRSRLENAIEGMSVASRAEKFCDSARGGGREISGACRVGRLHRVAFPLSVKEVGGLLDHLPVIVLRSGRSLVELLEGKQVVGGDAIDFDRSRVGTNSAYHFNRQIDQVFDDGTQIGMRFTKVSGLPRQVAVIVVPAARAEREWCFDYMRLIEEKGLVWTSDGLRASVTIGADGYLFEFGGLKGMVPTGRPDGWRYLRNQHWDYIQPSTAAREAAGRFAPPPPAALPFRLSRVGADPDDVVDDTALVYSLKDWAQLDDNLVNEFLAEMALGAPSLSGARLVQREAGRPSPMMFFTWPRVSGVASQPK